MGIELFERAVSGGGQLLRAEIAPLGSNTDVVAALLLTLDLGRIAVTAEPAEQALKVEYLETADAAPGGLQDASEEEPWWRVLGSPIARAWSTASERGGPSGVCVQFRGDDQNPRVVSLVPRAGAIAIRLETPPA